MNEPSGWFLTHLTTHKTGHYAVVKTKRQTFIPIHKCLYQFRFRNVHKLKIVLNKATTNCKIHVLGTHKTLSKYMGQARDAKQSSAL